MNRKIILLFATIIALFFGNMYYQKSCLNNSDYQKTTALVTSINHTYKNYKTISITYTVNNQTYTNITSANTGLFSPHINSHITIYYSKNNPKQLENPSNGYIGITLIAIGFILIAILIFDKFSILIHKIFNRY